MEDVSVFIVEDDPMVISILKNFTEKIPSFKFIGSGNSELDSLEAIKKLEPTLVLIDIFLPAGNGLNLLKQIRQDNLPVDVILITASRDTATVQETLRFGAVDYIIKPFNFERFQQALVNFINLKRLFEANKDVKQVDLDLYNSPADSTGLNHILSLPKGVHLLTMKQILNYLYQQHQALSCKEIAQALSMSRITTWRYLEYLAEKGKIEVSLEHGSRGRPTKHYKVAFSIEI